MKMVRYSLIYSYYDYCVYVLGWWFVEYNGKEGWAPYSYLEPLNRSLSNSRLSLSDDLDIVLAQKST